MADNVIDLRTERIKRRGLDEANAIALRQSMTNHPAGKRNK